MAYCKQACLLLGVKKRIKKIKEGRMKSHICVACSAKNLPVKHNCRKNPKY